MNNKHRFKFEGRSVTLFKQGMSPNWCVEFWAKGQRYRKRLGKDLVQAEAWAKAMIQAACAGVSLPELPREGQGEVVVAHGQRALLRKNASGNWCARVRLVMPGRPPQNLQRDLGTADLAQARVFAANLIVQLLTEAAGMPWPASQDSPVAFVPTALLPSLPQPQIKEERIEAYGQVVVLKPGNDGRWVLSLRVVGPDGTCLQVERRLVTTDLAEARALTTKIILRLNIEAAQIALLETA
jgi:hypothetical protein